MYYLINELEKLKFDSKTELNFKVQYKKDEICEIDYNNISQQKFEIKKKIALNPNTPEIILIELSNDNNFDIRAFVASNPNTPENILIEFYESYGTYFDIIKGLAKNPNTPQHILIKLFDKKLGNIYEHLAKNPNTPEDILIKFFDIDFVYINHSLAQNPSTPPNILKKLVDERGGKINEYLAKNPNTPEDTLIKFFNLNYEYLNYSLAQNPSMPKHILYELFISRNMKKILSQNFNSNLKEFLYLTILTSKSNEQKILAILQLLRKNKIENYNNISDIYFDKNKNRIINYYEKLLELIDIFIFQTENCKNDLYKSNIDNKNKIEQNLLNINQKIFDKNILNIKNFLKFDFEEVYNYLTKFKESVKSEFNDIQNILNSKDLFKIMKIEEKSAEHLALLEEKMFYLVYDEIEKLNKFNEVEKDLLNIIQELISFSKDYEKLSTNIKIDFFELCEKEFVDNIDELFLELKNEIYILNGKLSNLINDYFNAKIDIDTLMSSIEILKDMKQVIYKFYFEDRIPIFQKNIMSKGGNLLDKIEKENLLKQNFINIEKQILSLVEKNKDFYISFVIFFEKNRIDNLIFLEELPKDILNGLKDIKDICNNEFSKDIQEYVNMKDKKDKEYFSLLYKAKKLIEKDIK